MSRLLPAPRRKIIWFRWISMLACLRGESSEPFRFLLCFLPNRRGQPFPYHLFVDAPQRRQCPFTNLKCVFAPTILRRRSHAGAKLVAEFALFLLEYRNHPRHNCTLGWRVRTFLLQSCSGGTSPRPSKALAKT